MDLLDAVLVNNPELDESIETYLEKFGAYDELYIFCVKCIDKCAEKSNETQQRVIELLKSHYDIEDHDLFCLDNERLFFLLELKRTDSNVFSKKFMQQTSQSKIAVTMSVFHHNPLGSIWETIDSGLELLAQAEQESVDVLFNDFYDKN